MIDLKLLKSNTEFFKESFKNKGLNLDNEVDTVITKYDEYLELLNKEQLTREELNKISSKIKEDPSLKDEAKKISDNAKEITSKVTALNEEIETIVSHFPNPASKDVPVGSSEEENVVISTHNDDKKENKFSKPHWDIIDEKKLVLSEESITLAGARHVVYNDKAALLIKAIERFLIDCAIENDYTPMETPVLINREMLFNTGQLPKFEEDLFKVGDQYLIPTGEVPLTNLVSNKLLDIDQLPLNYAASTHCFRKEAGSAGKDTRGIIRLHEFRKVELVTIGKQEDEEIDFNRMLTSATSILDKLKLPYRLLQLCTGDISFSASKTIDIEVWMPGTDMYREISSVSSCTDFQARRMKARYKDSDNKKQFVNTYNGSALAIERLFAAIVENNIQEDGTIKVPTALENYLPFKEI